MSKIQPKDHADFVITMIDRDIAMINDSEDMLDYLRIILNYADDMGEQILRASQLGEGPVEIGRDIKTTIGENRPEREESDIQLMDALRTNFPDAAIINMSDDGFRTNLDLLAALFEATRSEGSKDLNPLEFCRTGECLTGAEAYDWLYARKFTHTYQHIHVFEGDRCLLLPDDEDAEPDTVQWIQPDGVKEEGDLMNVLQAMFVDYQEGVNG